MVNHSSILAWKIPWAEELGELQSMGPQRNRVTKTHTHTHTHNNYNKEVSAKHKGKRVYRVNI